jgi:hypothetical protein
MQIKFTHMPNSTNGLCGKQLKETWFLPTLDKPFINICQNIDNSNIVTSYFMVKPYELKVLGNLQQISIFASSLV